MSGRVDWFCNITAKFAGVSNKISKMVVVLERRKKRKEKKLFYLRIWVLVTWDIGFGKCLTFFVRLFPLVATVSFPNAPLHPS